MFYLAEAARLFLTLSLMVCVVQMPVQTFYNHIEEQSPPLVALLDRFLSLLSLHVVYCVIASLSCEILFLHQNEWSKGLYFAINSITLSYTESY